MDTNLKKSKKVRAFCYRMIATGALFVMIASAIVGREAIANYFEEGSGYLSGDIRYLVEFREHVARIVNTALTAYTGCGDDSGHPLTDEYADDYSDKMKKELDILLKEAGDDFIFYLEKGVWKKTNVSYPLLSEYDGHLMIPEGYELCADWNGDTEMFRFFNSGYQSAEGADLGIRRYYEGTYHPVHEKMGDIRRLVLAVKKHPASEKLSEMDWMAWGYQRMMLVMFASAAIWLVFALMSLFTPKAGKQAKAEYGAFARKLWLESKLAGILLLCIFAYEMRMPFLDESAYLRYHLYNRVWIYALFGCFWYLLVTDWKQNGLEMFINSLPVKCVRAVREFVEGKPWYRRAMALNASTLVGSLILFAGGIYSCNLNNLSFYTHPSVRSVLLELGILMMIAAVILMYCYTRQRRLLKDTRAVVDRLAKMREEDGGTKEAFVLPKNSLLKSTVKDLNDLEEGIETVVEQKNRSNKMRVELLTNVSHDLKTPLTSIINYADLLCDEELPESAAEYASSLREKAYRLKNMVQDVFDLSKATSGNLPVEKNTLDLVKLVRQTLADMDERIQASGLTFKLRIAEEPLMIDADGDKLYRVFQNLFVNALQYSLENSRVHVQLEEKDGYAVAMVKNTSRSELDFDLNEIMERFVRADASRTTEGSGLGLSIVQSFTEACGGAFSIQTDADMFTACVRFPLAQNMIGGAHEES